MTDVNFQTFIKRGEEPPSEPSEAAIKKKVNEMVLTLIKDGDLECAGYTSLDHDPTILTACQAIATLVGLVTVRRRRLR